MNPLSLLLEHLEQRPTAITGKVQQTRDNFEDNQASFPQLQYIQFQINEAGKLSQSIIDLRLILAE